MLLEQIKEAEYAEVANVSRTSRTKKRPMPLNTIDLQKLASKKLHFSASKTMDTAEKLYNKGLISYPRTETNYFNKNIDLIAIIKSLSSTKQKWSSYARKMFNNISSEKYFEYPKNGRLDDQAHPPIHPVESSNIGKLDRSQQKLYELICRHFLAICSHDGSCSNTRVTLKIGDENFTVSG